MTLRLDHVARQLPGVVSRFREESAFLDAALAGAAATLDRWADDPARGDERIRAAMAENPRPYALTLAEPPTLARPAPAFAPVTVVAADGSSIEPDRFSPVPCFVVSIGEAVIPYGIPGEPVLASRAEIGPFTLERDAEGEDRGEAESVAFGWGVNLQRDARELQRGSELLAERADRGPAVLLVDGTLFPWDLDSPQVAEAVRADARRRTQDALDLVHVHRATATMGAYVSASRAAEVVTSLHALAGGRAPRVPTDGAFFRTNLADGERSAVFRAVSERGERVEKLFSPAHQVCFFYLRLGDDLARVELPHWAASPAAVDLLHATLADQCRRGAGYPRVLQEAHEQAVISTGDRLQFAGLLEREAARQGLRPTLLGKQFSKRRRAV